MGIFDFFKKNKDIKNDNGLNLGYNHFGKGRLVEKYFMKKGKKHGMYERYDEIIIDGLTRFYSPKITIVKEKGNYKNGKKDGKWYTYWKGGENPKYFENHFINGKDVNNNDLPSELVKVNLHNSSDEKIKPSNLKKVWSKELLIGPPGQILLGVETELQNVELWNYFYKEKPFNGIVYYLKNQDEIFMLPPKNERIIDFQIELKNGIKDGKETGFYNNGKIQYTLYWEKGVRHGTETGFYKNGNIEYEKTFIYGNPILNSTEVFEHLDKNDNNDLPKWFKGELNEKGLTATNSTTGKSYELNNVEGTMFEHLLAVKTFYDMAQLNEEKNRFKIETKKFHNWFKINNPEAYKILIDSDLSLKIKNSNKKELRKEYYETGELESTVTCIGGLPQGERKTYYKSGKLMQTENLIDGVHQGESKNYYESGALEVTATYVDGLQQGEEKQYYVTGELKFISNFIDGLRQGEMKLYYKSGELRKTTNYIDGQDETVWKY